MTSRSSGLLASAHVLFVGKHTPESVRRFLPVGPRSVLTNDLVELRERSRSGRALRLEGIGALRGHSVNGSATPLACGAIVILALALPTTALGESVPAPWFAILATAAAITIAAIAIWILRIATAVQARRVTAGVWLGAYLDALVPSDQQSARRSTNRGQALRDLSRGRGKPAPGARASSERVARSAGTAL